MIGTVTDYTAEGGRPVRRAVNQDKRLAGLRPVTLDVHVDAPHLMIVASQSLKRGPLQVCVNRLS
jgi:hypothetical protein